MLIKEEYKISSQWCSCALQIKTKSGAKDNLTAHHTGYSVVMRADVSS